LEELCQQYGQLVRAFKEALRELPSLLDRLEEAVAISGRVLEQVRGAQTQLQEGQPAL
jgi:hypothetical protein